MRPVAFFCCLLTTASSLPGNPDPDTQAVTVLMEFTGVRSATSLNALKSELQTILSDSHLHLDLQLKSGRPDTSVSGDLVLFKMKGECTMNALPVGALSDERGPLAMTHSVNGELLPFGEVECDRVRTALQRTVGRSNPEAHQTEYGIALARVMAHEIYHMLAKSAAHTKEGVTKEALSSRELSSGTLRLAPAAQTAVQNRLPATGHFR
jgi:hypothetical protein